MYGNFVKNTAGYEINSLEMKTPWEYIYENGDILLKVDQYGPVYAQANPPGGIMLFKREQHQKYSVWQTFIKASDTKDKYSTFFRPNNMDFEVNPKKCKIEFLPEIARYTFEYNGIRCVTEYFIPSKGTTIVCKCSFKNISETLVDLQAFSHLVPYLNDAVIAPWDKYDWYLDTNFTNEKYAHFNTKLLSAELNSNKRRCVNFISDAKFANAHEVSLERYIGNGDINNPEHNFSEESRIYGYAPVYALKYNMMLAAGEDKSFIQVLTLDDISECEKYLNYDFYNDKKTERKNEIEKLFSVNRIKSGDEMFDYYANYWIPIQMKWVSSLDRGWPTGMRGSRDSAQDYTALLYLSAEPCRNIIMTMLECQRTDGWFPRQYSANGKHGKHDLRTHVDGGAFFVEFMWKYLAHTRDYEILDKYVEWLDSDEKSSVFEHLKRAVEFYIEAKNMGEHGLCKIYGGDWLDAVNGAGVKGRGESVTVSEQVVMALMYFSDIIRHTNINGNIEYYERCANDLKAAINHYAYNKDGYYNGLYNDDGKWIFSDNDPDGLKRIYGVSNYYAIISGVANNEQTKKVLSVCENLKTDKGYSLFLPYLGGKPIANVGRIASGDVPPYLGENGNVYNHGSQGFLARALAVAGNGNKLFDVLKWLMPYDTDKHPTEVALTPPYAIVNCWQQLPGFDHRGLMCFLTGSVAMAMRGVYEWMFGIQPCLDGIEFSPCLPDNMGVAEAEFMFLGKKYNLKINDGREVFLDGEKLVEKRKNIITGKDVYFCSYEKLNR